jgi:hypothetical protein
VALGQGIMHQPVLIVENHMNGFRDIPAGHGILTFPHRIVFSLWNTPPVPR